MRSSKIAFAVAAIVAAGSASAANVSLYVSGASAQRTFWGLDLAGTVCGTNPVTTYSITTSTTGVSTPDNLAFRCTAANAVSGVAVNDVVTMYYSAELGSIWGIAPFLSGSGRPTQRLFVNPDSADCGATSSDTTYQTNGRKAACTITGYGDALVLATPTVGVTDVEPKFWAQSQNWPGYASVGAATPTETEIAAIGTYKVMNGQAFSVIVNNSGPLGDSSGGNGTKQLSSSSVKAIVTGKYNTWGKVPEVGGGNTQPIKLCRRDQGSGTQVSASIFFTGYECGRSATGFATAAAQGKLDTAQGGGGVVENTTTGKVRTCVSGDNGAIGITSIGTGSSYTTLKLDGVQANAHNAAAGIYPFSFESYAIDFSPANTLSSVLIANAKKSANIKGQTETGSMTNGQWVATSVKSNFGVPATGFGNTNSIASWSSTSQASTALFNRGGDNCKVVFNSNAN